MFPMLLTIVRLETLLRLDSNNSDLAVEVHHSVVYVMLQNDPVLIIGYQTADFYLKPIEDALSRTECDW